MSLCGETVLLSVLLSGSVRGDQCGCRCGEMADAQDFKCAVSLFSRAPVQLICPALKVHGERTR